MGLKIKIYQNIDVRVKKILLLTEGWLVGNAINSIIKDDTVNDYDIIVSDRELFHKIVFFNMGDTKKIEINSYGGIKLNFGDVKVDLWCEELSHFLINSNKVTFLFNYKKNMLLKNK